MSLGLRHIPLAGLGYEEAYAIQQSHHEAVLAGRKSADAELGRVMMVEHPALITVTRRPDAPGHVLYSEAELLAEGCGVASDGSWRGCHLSWAGTVGVLSDCGFECGEDADS